MTIRRTERTAKTAQAKENAMTKRYDSHQAVAMNNNGTDNAKGTSMTKRIILAGMALACSFFMTTSMALAAAPNPNNDQVGCSRLAEQLAKAEKAAIKAIGAFFDACQNNIDTFQDLRLDYERYKSLRRRYRNTQLQLVPPADLEGFLQEAIDAEIKAREEYQSTAADYNAALAAGEPDHVLSELYDLHWNAYLNWVEKSEEVDDARDALAIGSAEWLFLQYYIDLYDWAIGRNLNSMQAIYDMIEPLYNEAKSAYDAYASAWDAYKRQNCQPPKKEEERIPEPDKDFLEFFKPPPGPHK